MPYRERIQPGDLSPGDLLPVADDDPRLVPTYSFGDDPLDADAKAQIRAGRPGPRPRPGPHALARGPRASPPQRWYDGDAGPDVALAQSAPEPCSTCGFLMRHHRPARRRSFGVCANGDANDDGRVVSFDHGCGAHSEVRLAKKHEPLPLPDPVVDTITPTRSRASSAPPQVARESTHTAYSSPAGCSS